MAVGYIKKSYPNENTHRYSVRTGIAPSTNASWRSNTMGAGQGALENVRHRYEEPKCVFLFDLVTTVYVGTGSLLEPSFGAQP